MSEAADLTELNEWRDYKDEPSPNTLARLLATLDRTGRRDALLVAFMRLFSETSNWRTGQHLARECIERGYVVLAVYYAVQALELSDNKAIPRLTLARALWEQRFCEAALLHLDEAQAEISELPVDRRAAFDLEIADLLANVYVYLHESDRADQWLDLLIRSPRVRADTLCRALTSHIEDERWAMAARLAEKLAPFERDLAPRHRSMVLHALRRKLLALIAGRI